MPVCLVQFPYADTARIVQDPVATTGRTQTRDMRTFSLQRLSCWCARDERDGSCCPKRRRPAMTTSKMLDDVRRTEHVAARSLAVGFILFGGCLSWGCPGFGLGCNACDCFLASWLLLDGVLLAFKRIVSFALRHCFTTYIYVLMAPRTTIRRIAYPSFLYIFFFNLFSSFSVSLSSLLLGHGLAWPFCSFSLFRR